MPLRKPSADSITPIQKQNRNEAEKYLNNVNCINNDRINEN